MLIGVQNVRAVVVEKLRNGRHDPLLVGTIDEQSSGVFHAAVPYKKVPSIISPVDRENKLVRTKTDYRARGRECPVTDCPCTQTRIPRLPHPQTPWCYPATNNGG